MPDGDAPNDSGSPDADTVPPDASRLPDVSEPPEIALGRIVGRTELPDGGVGLQIDEIDDGFAIRLAAGEPSEVAVEPIGRLVGPSNGGVYLGRGCQRAAAGKTKVLGVWSGDLERCATTLEPTAIMKGRPARPGCAVTPAPPGSYKLSIFRCGRYTEPLFDVTFSIEAREAPDAGAPDSAD